MITQPTDKLPVDVIYMVADLKYNAKQGVKICEVQQACLSLFNGDSFQNIPEEKSIHKELLRALSLYNKNGWVVSDGVADKKMVSALASSPTWRNSKDIMALFSDQNFRNQAKLPVSDIHDISSYPGFLYISWSNLYIITDFEKRLSGMVVIDKSSFPFWIDKYRMTELFAEDKILSTLKPRWGNYKKKYSKGLAEKIAKDLQCDTFVIKPRGQFLGNGVIIIQRQDLDGVLRYIITKKGKLSESKDPAYTCWKEDSYDSFIVEEFVASDLVKLSHLANKAYQPTMRVAFLLVYNKNIHTVHFLGGYWKTPSVSVNDEGDFMQKNKDICKPPYYCAVDDKIMQTVQNQLIIALPILHSKMIKYSNSLEKFSAPNINRNLRLVLQEN